MELLFWIIVISFFLVPAITFKLTKDIELTGVSSLLMVVIVAFISLPTSSYYRKAAEYKAIIEHQQPIVDKYTVHVQRLTEKIEKQSKNKQNIFTATHDKPVQALIEAHLKAEEKLIATETAIDEAKINLEAIRYGLFGFVVKWVEE